MTRDSGLRLVALLAVGLAAIAAAAGLLWTPPGEMPPAPDLHGRGLYRRDTPFTAGGAQGADLVTLALVFPAALWASAGSMDRARRLVLVVALAWTLYVGASLSLGAIAFNEAFPLYIAVIPSSALGLVLVLAQIEAPGPPRWLPAFLLACGLITGTACSLLLRLEMAAGTYPPGSYYTSRTTYALDLGLIAPGCLAAAIGLWRDRSWGMALALPLLGVAALLLPMMAAQTLMQLRSGVAVGAEAAVPFIGFALISAGAVHFLWKLAHAEGSRSRGPKS